MEGNLEIRPKTRQLENSPASRISLRQGRHKEPHEAVFNSTSVQARLVGAEPSRKEYFSALPLVGMEVAEEAVGTIRAHKLFFRIPKRCPRHCSLLQPC